MLTSHQPPWKATALVYGLGLAFAILGLIQVAGLLDPLVGTGGLPPDPFRPFMLAAALVLSILGAGRTASGSHRPSPANLLIAACCLAVGLWTVWCLPAGGARGPDALSGSLCLWPAFLGLAAVLVVTWRSWGAALTAAAMAAALYAAIWHTAHAAPPAGPADTLRGLAQSLWFNLDEGALGWVPAVLLSTVLPFFLLGSVLAQHMSLGLPKGPPFGDLTSGHRIFAALLAAGQRVMPTLFIGLLIMAERPGVGLSVLVTAMLLAAGACLAWCWLQPSGQPTFERTARPSLRDMLPIATATAALLLALTAGVSLPISAILALGLVIALSAFDAEIRRHPAILVRAFAQGGMAFAKLLVAAAAVGVILAVLDRTGLPLDVAPVLAGAAGESRFPLLVLTALIAMALGTQIPGIAVYLIVVTVIGPALRTVGLADLTIHLLVLVASSGASLIGRGAGAKARSGWY